MLRSKQCRSQTKRTACFPTSSFVRVARRLNVVQHTKLRCKQWHTELLGQLAVYQLAFPLVHQGPINRARPEISHVKIRFQPCDRLIDELIVFAKHRTVTRQKPFDVARPNSLERFNKVTNAAAMVRVDGADTAIAKQIVARQQKLAQSERKLACCVTWRVPNLQLQTPDF